MKSRVYLLWAVSAVLALLVCLDVQAFSAFQRSLNDRPWGINQVSNPVRAGRIGERFELRAGDCSEQPGWSDCLNDRERAEQSQLKPYIAMGEERWVSYSIMLAPNWRDISPVTVTLGQFHHRDSSQPAVLFIQRNGRYSLRIESAKSLYVGRDIIDLADIASMRGQWTDVVVQTVFRPDARGVIRVWVNGDLRATIQGVTTLGTTPVYFKYGIYRSFVSRNMARGSQTVYWDEVRSGATRAEVDARFNPRLQPKN